MALNHLLVLDAEIHTARPNTKPPTRKRVKGRKDRAEAKVKKAVRTACEQRDGRCRLYRAMVLGYGDQPLVGISSVNECIGPAQWAHMTARQRSKTRGMAPEVRHSTRYSMMLCQRHHDQYDGRAIYSRLLITALSRKGADGPLKFRRQG